MKNLLSTFAALILFSTVLFAQENQKSHNVTIQVPEVAMLGIAGNCRKRSFFFSNQQQSLVKLHIRSCQFEFNPQNYFGHHKRQSS